MPCEGHEKLVAYCSLYCGDCFFYKGEIADLAKQLRKKLREAKLTKNYMEFREVRQGVQGLPEVLRHPGGHDEDEVQGVQRRWWAAVLQDKEVLSQKGV